MFLAIIIIVLGACVSIIWSMYYNTVTMQKTYGSVNWYYWAYYWAMASMERWLLMSKLKYPTYEWMWWFKWDATYWAASNAFSGDFWKLTQWKNSLVRYVDSLTDTIVWTIDTQTLRSISFNKYKDDDAEKFNQKRSLDGTYWINDWLSFTWKIDPRSPNIWVIQSENEQTGLWETSDFNRFFSLKKKDYIVRGLKTTDTYGENNETYDEEWEKDFQLAWDFDFNKNSNNPRPALSWSLSKENYAP